MSALEVTEEFLLNQTGCKKLSDIKQLSLSELGLTHLPVALFNRLTNLEELDISDNNFTSVSPSLNLKKLTKLDCSQNQLTDIQFVAQFPKLEELYTQNNNLDASDRYIAVALCPKLQRYNKTREASLHQVVSNLRIKLRSQVKSVWEARYKSKLKTDNLTNNNFQTVLSQFMNDLRKQKLIEGKDLLKYKEFMLESVAQELMHSVQGNSHAGVSPRKRRRIEETEDEENYENTNHFSKIQPKPCILNLPDVPDYDPVHFVRCHAKDNNPSDNRTKVWKCAFEPELDNPGETTNIVATCGGDILCLLDCSTGKLMMRYKLPKEHFFTVAWTTVCSSTSSGRGSKRTNILATGGKLGIVHLIHPAQHLCYAELKGHTKYISSLLVHPEEPTWLFSGGADAKVILWDIGVPSFPDYKTSHKQLLVLQSPGGDVLNTVFLSNYLIAGCEKNCYGWHIDKSNLDKRMSRQPTLEINIPKPQNDIVDALVQVSNDIIATKCSQQGFIQLWRFSDVLTHAQNRKCVTAMPIARLKWKNVDTPYINLGAVLNAGLVYCGDDEGQLWIYNVKPVITKKIKKSTSYELMSPSRILPWPECCIPTEREQEKLMGDVLDKGEPIVINSATGSWNHEYIVAGTDNNLVCIWKKI